jgi:hypothetical protein
MSPHAFRRLETKYLSGWSWVSGLGLMRVLKARTTRSDLSLMVKPLLPIVMLPLL